MIIVAGQPGPSFSTHDVHVGWCEALSALGHRVIEYNLEERFRFYASIRAENADHEMVRTLTDPQVAELGVNGIYSTLYKVPADLLFITSPFFYPVELLASARRHGLRVVLLFTESPYQDRSQLAMAPYADVALINDPTNLELFRKINPRTYYMPHSYRPMVHTPGFPTREFVCDLAMVGTGYRSRVEYLESMDLDGLDVVLAGNWKTISKDSPIRKFLAHDANECIDNKQTVEIYRSAQCGLNLYRRDAESSEQSDGYSCGPREIEMAACGLFFARESRPESDILFPMLPVVESPDEASSVIRWYLAHENARHKAALDARTAIRDRTFNTRARELMALLDKG